MRILYTGDRGFISGYAIDELLKAGHTVFGIDNYSKYGKVEKSYDTHPNYTHVEMDARDVKGLMYILKFAKIDQMIASAARIGGISYFHSIPYTLLKENEEITIAAFEAAIQSKISKINVISSSMVFESAEVFPSKETDVLSVKVPISSYGFQKLATEYYCRAAFEEHGLKYTIIRPFNCVGTGEFRAKMDKEIMSGNIKLALSHVVPDLIQKVLKGQNPIHILGDGSQTRCYTYGGDIAVGIRHCVENSVSINEDFNISTPKSMTVIELLNLIWSKINPDKPLKIVNDPGFKNDVKYRVPDVSKAKNILGFEAKTDISDVIDEIIAWEKEAIAKDLI